MQFPDSLDETNRLIKVNRTEYRIIVAKLASGKIHPRSPKWRRLETRKEKLIEHNQGLVTHKEILERAGRISFSPPESRWERFPVAP